MIDFIKDIVRPTPKQLEFISAIHKHPYVLGGGEAGGGKTFALVAGIAYCNFLYAHYGNKHPVTALATTDNTTVKTRYGKHLQELLVSNGLGEITGGTKSSPAGFKFKDPAFGEIRFVSLWEPERIRGTQPWAMGIDELSLITEEQWIDTYWTVRFGGTNNPFPHIGPILCTSNPEGPGAEFVHQYFVLKTFDTPLGITSNQKPDDFCFIPFGLSDNPNKDFVDAYKSKLETLPDHRRRALLEGVWDSAQGARFKHPLQDVTLPTVPKHWPRAAGIDWGYSDQTIIVWVAYDEIGRAYVYRLYKGTERTPAEVAEIFLQMNQDDPLVGVWCDETMFRRESTGRSVASYFQEVGVKLRPCTNRHELTNPIIERRLSQSALLFVHGDKEIKDLIRCLRGIRFGTKTNPENLEPHSLTHSVYALGYVLFGAGNRCAVPIDNRSDEERHWEAREKEIRELYRVDKWQEQQLTF